MDSDRWNERWQRREQRRELRMQRRRERHQGPGAAFAGLMIIAIGALFLLQNLGVVYVQEVWQYWPLILIALGISRLVDNSWAGGVALMVIGAVFLARNLGFLYGNVWQYMWPLFLIGGGILLLLRSMGVITSCTPAPAAVGGTSSATSSLEDMLNIHIAFSAVERRIVSQEFGGGEIHVAFGGVELDLRNAKTKRDEIYLDVHAAFGGIELMIPETWTVVLRGTAAFGVFEDKTHPAPARMGEKAPRLILTGGAAFGGVTVKN